MRTHSKLPLLLAMLVLGTATFTLQRASASDGGTVVVTQAPRAPVVVFRSPSLWQTLPGTRVAMVRAGERPSYDLFRYGSRYYLYNADHWYSSPKQDGRYVMISDQRVPIAISRVPTQQWRSYPKGWMNPKNPHFNGRHDNGKKPQGKPGGKGN